LERSSRAEALAIDLILATRANNGKDVEEIATDLGENVSNR
jgi:hypothetical protein